TTRNCDIHFLVIAMLFTKTFLLMAHSEVVCKLWMDAGHTRWNLKFATNSLPSIQMNMLHMTLLTEETAANIQNRIQVNPNKSILKLSAQTGVSYGSVRTTLRKQLHSHDIEQQMAYCQWFNNATNNDILDLTFFSDEA
ncbi:hypothetical protein QE152_g37004, partial [Popillia japonica]